jgi:hypothetical protein
MNILYIVSVAPICILFGGAKYNNLLIPSPKKLEQYNDGLHN